MRTILLIMSLFVISTNAYGIICPTTKEELEDMMWQIDNWFDLDWFNKVVTNIFIVVFLITCVYFIYSAIILNNYIFTIAIATIIFNLANQFQLKIKYINTLELDINEKNAILQYIFSILEILIASNVILKIFQ